MCSHLRWPSASCHPSGFQLLSDEFESGGLSVSDSVQSTPCTGQCPMHCPHVLALAWALASEPEPEFKFYLWWD